MEDKIEITDEFIKKALATGKKYCFLIYKVGPNTNYSKEEVDKMQWEHLRYMFQLHAEGKLLLNGPITDHTELNAIGIFNSTDKDEVKRWMDEDPNVKSGRRTYELYTYFGIPGDRLS